MTDADDRLFEILRVAAAQVVGVTDAHAVATAQVSSLRALGFHLRPGPDILTTDFSGHEVVPEFEDDEDEET